MITKEELQYLRAIASASSDLIRSKNCEAFRECCSVVECEKALEKAVDEYEQWLEERDECYY